MLPHSQCVRERGYVCVSVCQRGGSGVVIVMLPHVRVSVICGVVPSTKQYTMLLCYAPTPTVYSPTLSCYAKLLQRGTCAAWRALQSGTSAVGSGTVPDPISTMVPFQTSLAPRYCSRPPQYHGTVPDGLSTRVPFEPCSFQYQSTFEAMSVPGCLL
eukprot:1977771-Rhodomonas_salina.2